MAFIRDTPPFDLITLQEVIRDLETMEQESGLLQAQLKGLRSWQALLMDFLGANSSEKS
jgi:hypothetical protein